MNVFSIIPTFAFLINGFVTVFIFAQKKKSKLINAYLLYSINLCAWILIEILVRQNITENLIPVFLKLESVFWLSIGFWFLNFTYKLLDKPRDMFFYSTGGIAFLAIIISLTTNFIINDYIRFFWGVDASTGPLYMFFIFLSIVIPGSYGIHIMIKTLAETRNMLLKHSLPLIITGTVFSLVLGFIANVFIPHILNLRNSFQFAESASAIQSIFIFVAVYKYRLFGLDLEDFSKLLFNSTEDAVIILNNDDKIVQMNKSAENIFEQSFSELQNQNLNQIVYQFGSIPYDETSEMELNINRKNKIISITKSRIEQKETLLGTIIFIRDITIRKEAERSLLKSQKQLRALSASLQSTREEERKHIAREIHDELGQVLTAINMDVGLLIDGIENSEIESDDQVIEYLRSIEELVDGSIQSVRNIASELRPDVLDHLGLISAIEWYLEEFSKRYKIDYQFNNSTGAMDFSDEERVAVFRIVQEALTNVARHAEATKVEISIKYNNKKLLIFINDNGKGIREDKIENIQSIGIIGMKERVSLIGGGLYIKRNENGGTTVQLEVPMKKPEEKFYEDNSG